MARSRRGGGGSSFGSSRPAARPAARRPAAQPPATRNASTSSSVPAPQQSSGGGMLSGIGSTIAQGMAFGTGSAVAHRAVGAMAGSFGGGGEQEQAPEGSYPAADQGQMQQQQQLSGPCANDKQMFFECLKQNNGDQQTCNFLYENLQACQRGDNQMSFN